jgi:hypothetical protein
MQVPAYGHDASGLKHQVIQGGAQLQQLQVAGLACKGAHQIMPIHFF